MSDPTEHNVLDYMRELAALERDGERTDLRIGPYTAFLTISALQLASRHPIMRGVGVQVIRTVVDQLKPLFAGTPGEQLLLQGEHPEFDVAQDGRPAGAYPITISIGPHQEEVGRIVGGAPDLANPHERELVAMMIRDWATSFEDRDE